jgi:hypothetical protein
MSPDLIAPLLLCVVIGFGLSLVVAAFLSQPGRNFTLSDVAARLVLAAGPIYVVAAYVTDKGTGPTVASAAGLLFGLYCLRGWWVPQHFFGALDAAVNALCAVRARHVNGESDSLRHRMLSVVDADRRLAERAAGGDQRLERPARSGSLAKAA